VFVSYSQPDREIAEQIVAHLEPEGLPCWVAPRNVRPGRDWAEEIVDAIAAARLMVLVFSASANSSVQVRREVERAVHRRVVVLPFRVESVNPAGSLEYFLSSQQWLDAFPPPMEPHYARLLAYLKSHLAEAGVFAPASSAAEGEASAPVWQPSPTMLARLEAELARYIGPVARLLVNRAARRATGIDTLILDLGAEIDSETERRQFINASRQSLHGRS
jgi:hypothetical protein